MHGGDTFGIGKSDVKVAALDVEYPTEQFYRAIICSNEGKYRFLCQMLRYL